jgi:hypothetical protein
MPAAMLIGMLSGAGRAEAGLALSLSDTADLASVTIHDNGPGDLNPTTGVLLFSGTVGEFAINVTTGESKPVLGNGSLPEMDLNSVNTKLSGSKADTLIIKLTDTDWSPTKTSTILTQSVGGTLNHSITSATFNTYIDPKNNEFGTGAGTIKGTALTFTSSAFSGMNDLTYGALSGPYSVTQVVTIVAGAGLGTVSYDFALTPVPEPSSLTLSGVAILAGLSLAYRRSRRKSA